jgi:hypothetical protein
MSINVHIERLILEGMSGQMDRAKLGAAVEAELAQLLTHEKLACAVSSSEPRLIAPPVALVRPNDSRIVGKQIAGALHEVLSPAARITAHPSCLS